jgi:Family of unknown function (DUF6298)
VAPRALLLALLLACGLAVSAEPSSTAGAGRTLRLSTVNPRYFTDSTGRAVYLTGSHVWWNLVGDRTWRVHCDLGAVRSFKYDDYLDRLADHNHNFIRLWTIELTAWEECGDRVTIPLQPWLRPGPGRAHDGLPKFDLRRFNSAYFRRLRARVAAARARGLYVSVMLFEGWGPQFQPPPWRASSHPFHRGNNVNGVSPDRNRDGKLLEIYTLRSPSARRFQEAYVRKVIDTVRSFDNVLYEIANENGSFSIPWQYHMIRFVKRYQARRGGLRHPVGMSYVHGDLPGRSLYRSPADWIAPHDTRHLSDPPAAAGRKVVLSDTDHHCGGCGDATFPWRVFMRGYSPLFMDEFTREPRAEQIRLAMGNTRRYATRITLARMTPRGDLCSTRYCLVWPGREYLVYQPGEGPFSVALAPGRFTVEWMHPVSGRITQVDPVDGGGPTRLRPPFAGAAVAYLRRR